MTPVLFRRGAVTFYAAMAIAFAATGPGVEAAMRVGVSLSPSSAAAGGRGRATIAVRRLRQGADGSLLAHGGIYANLVSAQLAGQAGRVNGRSSRGVPAPAHGGATG